MKYPIIVVKKDQNMIFWFKSNRMFTISNDDLLNIGAFNVGIIIDSNQNIYELKGAKSIGWRKPLWGFNPLVKGREIKVEPIISSPKYSSLEEIKTILLDSIIFDKYWEESFVDRSEFIDSIKKSKSINELIELFR